MKCSNKLQQNEIDDVHWNEELDVFNSQLTEIQVRIDSLDAKADEKKIDKLKK